MTTVQIAIYVILLCLEVMGISMFMEWYKKCFRKDNFKKWEIYSIAVILSFVAVVLLIGINVFKPVLGLIGAPLWVDIVAYTACIFLLQMQTDMKIVKKIIDSFLPTLLKRSGLSDEQVKEILYTIESSKTK